MRIARSAVACALLSAAAPAVALPYAAFQARIDGDLSEWREPVFEVEFAEDEAPPSQRNALHLRLAWTLDGLLIAGAMRDADPVAAPAELTVEQFHQYDSVQIYIDPLDDSTTRMNRDDIDLLLLPDGRSGVLRGDDLIASLAEARVPQRQSVPLAHTYATRRDKHGWTFELALPFAGLGLSEPAGRALKLDVVMNDWIAAHAPVTEAGFPVEALRSGELPAQAPIADEVGTQVWPLSWDGLRDFGYPSKWRSVRLLGDAPASERAMRSIGSRRLLVIAALLTLVVAIGAVATTEWVARRRLRRLIARMQSAPTAASPGADPASEISPQPANASEMLVIAPAAATLPAGATVDQRDREFAEQVLAHVQAHLADGLAPAQLAAAMHVSLRTLQRRLRDGMDTSPQDMVLAARLAAAHALLRAGELRVGAAAYRVGFDDLSHFSRRFRAAYGVPPSQVAAHARPDREGL